MYIPGQINPPATQPQWPGTPTNPVYGPLPEPVIPSFQPNYPPASYPMDPNALGPLQQAYRDSMREILTNPRKRRDFMSIMKDMQSGNFTPDGLAERISRLMQTEKHTDKPSGAQVASAVGISTAIGLGLGGLVKKMFSSLEQGRHSLVEKSLRLTDNIPGLHSLSKGLERYFERAYRAEGIHPDLFLNLDGAYYNPAQLRSFYVQRHFGKQGFLNTALQDLKIQLRPYLSHKQTYSVVNGFQKATRYSELQQVMHPELMHFLPDSLRPVLHQLGDYKELRLWQVDQHSTKNYFLKLLGEASYEQAIDPKIARRIFDELRDSKVTFADFYEKHLLKNKTYRKSMRQLFKGDTITSYQALRDRMGLKPFWLYLNEATQNLLYRGKYQTSLNALPSETLANIEKRIVRFHVAGRLKLTPAWSAFEKKIRGTILRIHGFETHAMPILEAEYTLMKTLKSRGIGPIGRVAGKLLFNLNQMFNAGNFQRWTLQTVGVSGGLANVWGSNLGRLFLALLIFGTAAMDGVNSPKEHRKAKLADRLALGIAGYYGYTLALSLFPRLQLPKALPLIHKLNVLKIPGLNFTLGGFTQYVILTAYFSNKVIDLVKPTVHKIFGKPPKDGDEDDIKVPENLTALNKQQGLPPFLGQNSGLASSPMNPAWPSPTQYTPTLAPMGFPSTTNNQQNTPLATAPLKPEQATKESSAQSTPSSTEQQQPQVLYSTKGLESPWQLARNRRSEKNQNSDLQLAKELKAMQRELY